MQASIRNIKPKVRWWDTVHKLGYAAITWQWVQFVQNIFHSASVALSVFFQSVYKMLHYTANFVVFASCKLKAKKSIHMYFLSNLLLMVSCDIFSCAILFVLGISKSYIVYNIHGNEIDEILNHKSSFCEIHGSALFRWNSSQVHVKHICPCIIFCPFFSWLPVSPFKKGCNHA